MTIGTALLMSFKTMIDHAKELNDQLSLMREAGYSEADIASTREAAFRTATSVPGCASTS
jgi:hypothetical protein